jgi:hypothetical protein
VEEEMQSAKSLWTEVLPEQECYSAYFDGAQLDCILSLEDRTPTTYLGAAQVFETKVGSSDGPLHRSMPLRRAEEAVLQISLAQRDGRWLILAIDRLSAMQEDYHTVCSWLSQSGVCVAPVIEVADRLQARESTKR